MADMHEVKLVVGYADGHVFHAPCARSDAEKAISDIAKIGGSAGTVNVGSVVTIETYSVRYAYIDPGFTASSE